MYSFVCFNAFLVIMFGYQYHCSSTPFQHGVLQRANWKRLNRTNSAADRPMLLRRGKLVYYETRDSSRTTGEIAASSGNAAPIAAFPRFILHAEFFV